MQSKIIILGLFFSLSLISQKANAQLLNKLKKKVENSVSKPADNTASSETGTEAGKETTGTASNTTPPATEQAKTGQEDSDFIPGSTVLYFDNFASEKNGDSPAGWITSGSAEVVGLDGLKGKWLKLASVSTKHYTRNKKQSWGNSFTIEMDLVILKDDYDPRIDFALINTNGKLVTDEMILRDAKNMAYVATILGNKGHMSRVSLHGNDNIYKSIEDKMTESLNYTKGIPVHVAFCVQGKRFRFWWNDKKIFDREIVNEQYMPNQFGISFGSVGGAEYCISNIRIAKDIPAQKPAKSATAVAEEPVATNDNKRVANSNAPATVNFQSKLLTISLPYAQIMKTGEFTYEFTASKEEGNNKQNFFTLKLQSANTSLKAETFNFPEINKKNPLYGSKRFGEISSTSAVLYYGNVQKPYIYKFSPIIANGTMASYVDEALLRHLPAPSANTKLVIEKVEDGRASGYFLFGMMIQGLKPVTKGDAMTETFTDGFSGEVKCTFSNVPVY